MRASAAMKTRDSTRPPTPPASDSSSDSVITCRMIRKAPAPSDTRIANSASRAAVCALSNPARFAQQTHEQDGSHGREHRDQARLLVVFRHPARLADRDAAVLADWRVPPRRRHDRGEFRRGIGHGSPWREPPDHRERRAVGGKRVVAPPITGTQHHRRDIQVNRQGCHGDRARWRDADDRERHAVDRHRRSERCGRRVEPRPPEVVSDDDHAVAIGDAIFIGAKESTESGLHAEQREIVCRDDGAIHFFRVAADCNKERRRRIVRGEAAHGRRAIAERDVVGIRHGSVTPPTAACRADDDQSLRVVHRRRAPEQRIGQAGDGRDRCRRKRDRCDRRAREHRRSPHRTDSVPHVLHHRLDERDAACIATVLRDLRHAAEVEPRAARCLGGRDPRRDVLLGLALEMEAQLVGELPLDGSTPDERADPEKDVGEHVRRPSCDRAAG